MTRSFFQRAKASLSWRIRQAATAPGRAAAYVLATPYHDLVLVRKMRRTNGQRRPGDRVCIYTIFPVAGVQPSHCDTLHAACRAGFSPIVVSNMALTESDHQLLLPYCSEILERPNFGYDFGAYRAGIRAIRPLADTLQELVLINDSIWLPVGPGNWLHDVAGHTSDLVAAASNYGLNRITADGSDWAYNPGLPRFHYCSFALRFGPSILRSADFWRFWDRFRLSNDKVKTIQRGELGLSRMIIDKGHSHCTTYRVEEIPAQLAHADKATLRMIADTLIIPEDQTLRTRRDALLSDADTSQATLRRFILTAIAETGPAYASPDLAIDQLGVSFLKKSPLWLDEAGAAVTMSVIRRHCPPAYLAEAHLLRQQKGLPQQPHTQD